MDRSLVTVDQLLVPVWLLAALLTVRLATLGLYPLLDTTEARYGNVARVMLATGNWVTPQNAPGEPFWAKPPLYAWASAGSMGVFGVSEFAVRLPSVLFAAATLWITMRWAQALALDRGASRTAARRHGRATSVILGTSVLFFVSAGAVMTEATLVFATTWIGTAFWFAVVRTDAAGAAAFWRWGFFVAVGLGLLAKGPVALVYAGLPIFAWTCWQGAWRSLWARLPWVWGTLLSAAIAVPWYVAAEIRTPGFLRYFLLGEHFGRFLVPHWQGDKYGGAHSFPPGTIWVFWLGAALPWSFVAIARSVAWWRARRAGDAVPLDASTRYLVLTAVIPLVFFTAARNIIWTYPLSTLPALAVLLTPSLTTATAGVRRWVAGTALAVLAGFALIFGVLVPHVFFDHWSAGPIVARYRQEAARQPGPLYFVADDVPHSGNFYSAGTAKAFWPAAPTEPVPGPVYFAIKANRSAPANTAALGANVTLVAQTHAYRLYFRRWRAAPCWFRPRRTTMTTIASGLDPRSAIRAESRLRVSVAAPMAVILPVYAAGPAIEASVARIVAFADTATHYTFVFVDDGSPDDTGGHLSAAVARAAHPRVAAIGYPINRGKGAAIAYGFAHADPAAEYLAFLDSDLPYELADLDALHTALDTADVAIGSRALARQAHGAPLRRHFIGRCFNLAVRLGFGFPYQDTQAGLKGFRRAAAAHLFGAMTTAGFGFDVEVLYLARHQGWRVVEIPAHLEAGHAFEIRPGRLLRIAVRMVREIVRIRTSTLLGRHGHR